MEAPQPLLRPGFGYRYGLWTDDQMLSRYEEENTFSSSRCEERRFLVEVETKFILKPISGQEKVMDRESFATFLWVSDLELVLLNRTSYRLSEYWIPMDSIESLVHELFCFAKQKQKTTTTKSAVIPIVLGLDVLTVQSEKESLDEAMIRMIKADRLIPFHLWDEISMMVPWYDRKPVEIFGKRLRNYLLGLPRERVEEVDKDKALSRMELCPICLCPPACGARLTHLSCNRKHVFHNHCIVRWLLLNESCPLCRLKVCPSDSD